MSINKAFTLIELLVVVAIIGILATVVVVNVSGAQNKARYVTTLSDMRSIEQAAKLFQVETGNWPINVWYEDGTSAPIREGVRDHTYTNNWLPAEFLINGERKQLQKWPVPPVCNNWVYDWDYDPTTYARITLRSNILDIATAKTSSSNYYLCVDKISASCAGDPNHWGGGTDILAVNTLSCQ